jgi:hypothetical protein
LPRLLKQGDVKLELKKKQMLFLSANSPVVGSPGGGVLFSQNNVRARLIKKPAPKPVMRAATVRFIIRF